MCVWRWWWWWLWGGGGYNHVNYFYSVVKAQSDIALQEIYHISACRLNALFIAIVLFVIMCIICIITGPDSILFWNYLPVGISWYTVKTLSRHNKTKIQSTMYISVNYSGHDSTVSWVLKTEGRQSDNPAVTDITISCNDNARYHQWRQWCQYDDPLISARKKYCNNRD